MALALAQALAMAQVMAQAVEKMNNGNPMNTKQLVEKFDALQPKQESAPFGLDMPTPAAPQEVPAGWTEMVTVNLVREGVNKHKARELAQHFYMLAAAPKGVV